MAISALLQLSSDTVKHTFQALRTEWFFELLLALSMRNKCIPQRGTIVRLQTCLAVRYMRPARPMKAGLIQ